MLLFEMYIVHTLYIVFHNNDAIYIFLNNWLKNEPILIIFGVWNAKETSHQKCTN